MSKIAKTTVAAIVAVAMLTTLSTEARADCGCGRGGFSGAYGFGYSGSLYGLRYIPTPPYFAIHPPVYYGERVRRSYGRSPYAQLPARVKVEKAKPRLVVNTTMKKKAEAPKPAEKPTAHQTAARPKMIVNPYVNGGEVAGQLVADQE